MKIRPASAPQGRKCDSPNTNYMGCFDISGRRRASLIRKANRRPTVKEIRR